MEQRILIVDNEEGIREVVSSMLASGGYQYQAVAGGLEALALLDSSKDGFELLLSDLANGPMDGFGLLEQMNERFPDVPVVIVTASHDISDVLTAVRKGAYDYLLKPFENEQLLAVVHRALEYRRLKLENRTLKEALQQLSENHKH